MKHLARLVCLVVLCIMAMAPYTQTAKALSDEQTRLLQKGIYYYNVDSCSAVAAKTDVSIQAGTGDPKGAAFPNLDPDSMGKAINQFINQENPKSAMAGLGATVVKSAKAANISPFLIVSIAHEESNLADPSDFNVSTGSNSFGRTAGAGQPSFQGARSWYKWSSVQASVDSKAAENKNATGGGDIAAYIRAQYNSKIADGTITDIMNAYAPPAENDTKNYVANIKKWTNNMIQLTQGASTSDPGDPSGGGSDTSVYMLGDSITLGGKSALDSQFKQNGASSVTINGSVGRSITGKGTTAGQKTSGLEAVDEDTATIKNANIIVVALGTNPENGFKDNIKTLLDKIKGINSDAKLYWVNVFSTGGNVEKSKSNSAINDQANSQNYKVVDISGLDKDIELESDNIHPKPSSYAKYAKTVVDGIGSLTTSSGPQADAATADCSCGGGTDSDVSLSGSDNAQKIFNYFVAQGLSPAQAAGIMGNMNHESGLNPKALEPGTTGDAPIAGRGYGLIQWTFPARQDPLIQKAKDEGKPVYDLKLQLDYVMDELKGSYKSVYEALQNAQTTDEATSIIELRFEIHAGGPQQDRKDKAKEFLQTLGNGASTNASSSPDPVACAASNDSSGEVTGNYAFPVAKSFFQQHPEWFSSPHHDYSADDIPVPDGTPVYSITEGTIVSAPAGGGCGNGLFIKTSDGTEYGYCHGSDGGSVRGAKNGDTVKAGQLIMHTDNTGHTTGTHLHVQIKVKGELHCPQTLLKAIADGTDIPKEADLPTTGCSR